METILILSVVAIFAGFIDVLAGGGGLLTVPAMLMSGVPVLNALGTNKLQSTMGVATATITLIRKRAIRWSQVRGFMLAAFLGSALGTVLVQLIDTGALEVIIPCVIFVIAVYFIISPTPKSAAQPRLSKKSYKRYVLPVIGCYDGAFGPGTGSFFACAGVVCRGQDLIQATIQAKSFNFATNVAALIVFVVYGQVVWLLGLGMMVGQFIGASVASRCLLSVSPHVLRVLIVVVSLSMLVKYLFF